MMTIDSALYQNPFLDPYASLQGGLVSPVSSPLTRLQIPDVTTLLKAEEVQSGLSMVSVPAVLSRTKTGPQQPVVVRNEAVGIELSLAVTRPSGQPTGEVPPVQSGIQPLPTNMREARDALAKISPQRTGTKTKVYGINELKQIARNLNLPSTGNKDALANRIRTAVIEYFNLPPQ